MISAFYKFAPCKKERITRQKGRTELFMIPQQHLLDNQHDIARLKKQCQDYQRQFAFIKNQIDREARLKKEKTRDHFQMDRQQLENALQPKSPHQDRSQRRKQLGITDRELNRKKACLAAGRQEEQIIVSSLGVSRTINV